MKECIKINILKISKILLFALVFVIAIYVNKVYAVGNQFYSILNNDYGEPELRYRMFTAAYWESVRDYPSKITDRSAGNRVGTAGSFYYEGWKDSYWIYNDDRIATKKGSPGSSFRTIGVMFHSKPSSWYSYDGGATCGYTIFYGDLTYDNIVENLSNISAQGQLAASIGSIENYQNNILYTIGLGSNYSSPSPYFQSNITNVINTVKAGGGELSYGYPIFRHGIVCDIDSYGNRTDNMDISDYHLKADQTKALYNAVYEGIQEGKYDVPQIDNKNYVYFSNITEIADNHYMLTGAEMIYKITKTFNWGNSSRGTLDESEDSMGSVLNLYDNILILPEEEKQTIIIEHIDIDTNQTISADIINNSPFIINNGRNDVSQENEDISLSPTSANSAMVEYTDQIKHGKDITVKTLDTSVSRALSNGKIILGDGYYCVGYNYSIASTKEAAYYDVWTSEANNIMIESRLPSKGDIKIYNPQRVGKYIVLRVYYSTYQREVKIKHVLLGEDNKILSIIETGDTATLTPYDNLYTGEELKSVSRNNFEEHYIVPKKREITLNLSKACDKLMNDYSDVSDDLRFSGVTIYGTDEVDEYSNHKIGEKITYDSSADIKIKELANNPGVRINNDWANKDKIYLYFYNDKKTIIDKQTDSCYFVVYYKIAPKNVYRNLSTQINGTIDVVKDNVNSRDNQYNSICNSYYSVPASTKKITSKLKMKVGDIPLFYVKGLEVNLKDSGLSPYLLKNVMLCVLDKIEMYPQEDNGVMTANKYIINVSEKFSILEVRLENEDKTYKIIYTVDGEEEKKFDLYSYEGINDESSNDEYLKKICEVTKNYYSSAVSIDDNLGNISGDIKVDVSNGIRKFSAKAIYKTITYGLSNATTPDSPKYSNTLYTEGEDEEIHSTGNTFIDNVYYAKDNMTRKIEGEDGNGNAEQAVNYYLKPDNKDSIVEIKPEDIKDTGPNDTYYKGHINIYDPITVIANSYVDGNLKTSIEQYKEFEIRANANIGYTGNAYRTDGLANEMTLKKYLFGYYIWFDFDVVGIKLNGNSYKKGERIPAGTIIGPVYDIKQADGNNYASIKAKTYHSETGSSKDFTASRNGYTVRALVINTPISLRLESLKYSKISCLDSTKDPNATFCNKIKNECYANGYFAETTKKITPLEILYDFKITDVADINYKSVFRKVTGSTATAHKKVAYYSGVKETSFNEESDTMYLMRKSNQIGTTVKKILPVGPYKNTDTTYIKAPKMGYRFSFDVKLTGNYSSSNKLNITPTFYYISKSGSYESILDEGKPTIGKGIYLFYKNSKGEYVRVGSNSDKYEIFYTPGDLYRYTEYRSGVDVNWLSKDSISIGKLSALELKANKSAINAKGVTIWYGEYKLPNSTIAVSVDSSGKYDINKPLKDGYIGVKFDITSGTVNYENQWEKEGYLGYDDKIVKTKDADGNAIDEQNIIFNLSYKFEKGILTIDNKEKYNKIKSTVMFYDLDARADNDFS